MKYVLSILTIALATPAIAENTRQLDAHEHGIGALNIAIEGATVAMEFHAPGADIVGFEYAAKSDADHAAIDAAVTTLSAPLDLFVFPDAAGCIVASAKAALESEEGHEDHAEHDDDHADEAGHTEFHAEYTLNCDAPDALTQITFSYFDAFPNAKEVEVQLITSSGANAFEVERGAPILDLRR